MALFSVYKLEFYLDVVVYNSVKDFVNRVEWQDVLDEELILLDEVGNQYVWDESKIDEIGTINNYTLKKKFINIELAEICNEHYKMSNFSNDFKIEINK